MSKHFGLVPVLLSAVLATAAVPAPALAAPVALKAPAAQVLAARSFSRSFGRSVYRTRPYSRGYRSPSYTRSYRRYSPWHGFGGSILKGLGIAYLVHSLFGWGPGGGSPFGLLILVALVAWLIGRSGGRRRRYAA